AGLRLQEPRILRHADRFLAVSEASARRLFELGLPPARTSVLRNFVPAGSFAQSTGADAGTHVLVAGRLVEEKGYDTAIAAARAAGVRLLIAGEGPDEPRLRRLAEGAD